VVLLAAELICFTTNRKRTLHPYRHTCTHTHICMDTYTHVHTYTRTHTHTRRRTPTFTQNAYVHTHTVPSIYLNAHILHKLMDAGHTHAHIHTHIHRHTRSTHTCIHTCSCMCGCRCTPAYLVGVGSHLTRMTPSIGFIQGIL